VKVLLLGVSPLPWEEAHRAYAPGLRTWQFASALAGDDHDVTLIARRYSESYCDDMADVVERNHGGVRVLLVSDSVFMTSDLIQQEHDALRPHCIVAATMLPAVRAVDVATDRPVWVDLFGHLMAEGQAKAAVYDDDHLLGFYYQAACRVLDNADVFSTISWAQQHAVVGELGLRGRLSKAAVGYEFVSRVPLGVDSRELVWVGPAFRGTDVPSDAFVVLWSGGYNTWCDIETLFAGLEEAMRRNPRIWFVSTGGELKVQDELTYARFRSMADSSALKERFVFRGWLPGAALINYYLEANVGINVDKNIYEVRLGTKSRIYEWLRAGLVPVTTRVCELSYQLDRAGLGFTFPPGRPDKLTDLLVQAAETPDGVAAMSQRARRFAAEYLSPGRTARALRRWVKHPVQAPDRGSRLHLEEEVEPFLSLNRLAESSRERLAELDRAVHDKEVHIGNLEDRTTYLEGILEDKDVHITNLETSLSQSREEAQRGNAENAELRERLRQTEESLKAKEAELNQAHDRIVRLGETSRETERKRTEAEEAVTVREQALEDLEAAIDNLNANIELLKQELGRREARIDELEAFKQRVTGTASYKLYKRFKSALPGRTPS
jgi:glycosyltransferase involved in cell wall biosynthesis